MDIIYKYDKNSLISFYDGSFNPNYYFEYEIKEINKNSNSSNICKVFNSENKKSIISRKPILFSKTKCNRKIINKDILKDVIYQNGNIYEKTSDGIIYSNNVGKILLISIGQNIYLLAYYDSPLKNLKSMLYSFMSDYDCVIDVTKFGFLFKSECETLLMYKKNK